MPKNQVTPENSSVNSVSGSVARPANPTPTTAAAGASGGGGGRTANFSGTNSDAGSKLSSIGTAAVAARRFTNTNGHVRIPLHPSEPRGDDARGRTDKAAWLTIIIQGMNKLAARKFHCMSS